MRPDDSPGCEGLMTKKGISISQGGSAFKKVGRLATSMPLQSIERARSLGLLASS